MKVNEKIPAHTIALGNVKCYIRENVTTEGVVWYSATLFREYADDKGRGRSGSFGVHDLLVVGEVTRQAYIWIDQALNRE